MNPILHWDAPDDGWPDYWLHWDQEMFFGNYLWASDITDLDCAARWTPEQLLPYEGLSVTQISFFPSPDPLMSYSIKIWEGAGPDSLVLFQDVSEINLYEWNTITLENPWFIDITKELWIGLHTYSEAGYSVGIDDGPAIEGFGNMIYYDSSWSILNELNPSLDFNWSIGVHFGPEPGAPQFNYKIYRKLEDSDFELIDSVSNGHIYIENFINYNQNICYKVSAIWLNPEDTCESVPGDAVCNYITNIESITKDFHKSHIYPNPTSRFLNIESTEKISEVSIYNVLGECVLKLEIGNSEGKVDVRGLENGIYFVEVVTGKMNSKDNILIFR